jgi:hypothetical protein
MAKATTTTSVPTGAGNTVVTPNPGRLMQVQVVSAGTGTGGVLFYDNATTTSGTVVGYIPATVTVGQIFSFDMPVAAGIVVQNVSAGPQLTVSWA